MKYRKISTIVDAYIWTGGLEEEEDPEWSCELIQDGFITFTRDGTKMVIQGTDGWTVVEVGDYVIRDESGAIYSCKPDVFEKDHAKVLEPINWSILDDSNICNIKLILQSQVDKLEKDPERDVSSNLTINQLKRDTESLSKLCQLACLYLEYQQRVQCP